MTETPDRTQPLILVVDDEPFIRDCFSDTLEDSGYDPLVAENGRIALELIEEHHPDLILCDMQMPEVGGLEVVRTVHEKYPNLPIIVVSGAGVIEDAIEAVREGAWDYLVKPLYSLKTLIQSVEKALERAHLIAENQEYQKNLEKRTLELQKEIEDREKAEKKLVQSEKMAALGDLVAGVAHEINTPLGIGVTGISYLQDATNTFQQLFETGEAKKSDLEKFLKDCREACEVTLSNLSRAAQLVTGFKQIAVDQSSDERRTFNVKEYIQEILFSLYPRIKKTKHTVDLDCPEELVIDSYPGAFSQILTNLVMNSLIHGFEDIEQGTISIAIMQENSSLTLHYKDDGKGMTEEQRTKIYDPFYTTKRGSGGTGLGMNLVFNLVSEKFTGEIECESTPGGGVHITISIPNVVKSGEAS
ncbi:hybrid sensor histidine kinase/response regulator [Desulfogranum japonicum]|uniref:hybrid sensor histidine kinase/response regulator n=1 Tax=Desulfogranum japonicum TaxID=231447 RepID=UPI00042264A8|nr:hybrid sensor histidine kinase/response regulator [Desulfogranum japonicum]